ncbi:transposase [Kitasatospora sp. MAA19]|uniref:transposase n=1 Tax=unclassified Kitasatospora TaxID=2633591 RepID=UPI002473D0B4|nr:transposase [Kitasatospora sp. MAA19]MDH6709066.1 transposase [Kitasatospora sp. MAA19]
MLDAIRYLVDNGIKWSAMPADFPQGDRVYAFLRRWRDRDLAKSPLVPRRLRRSGRPGRSCSMTEAIGPPAPRRVKRADSRRRGELDGAAWPKSH